MGTTVATNALLERKGKKFALVITKGFKDLMLIGNQSRPNIFKLNIKRFEKLFAEVLEVDERVKIVKKPSENSIVGITNEYFEIVKPLNIESIKSSLLELRGKGIDTLAISLVHSYSFRDHETQIESLAKTLGFTCISLGSSIMPLFKFLPRTSTACIDAYLTPVLKDYISSFKQGFDANIEKIPVLFMQSDGGLCSINNFIGSKAILSGPAGGVLGYSKTGTPPLIGFDMGGTSTDVSRFDGMLGHIFETEISGIPLQGAHLDINTVAAGGGSRLFYRSGLYIVGPESSSAHPGPLCYRKNGFLSLTDANLVLGRLVPDHFPKIFGTTEDMPLDYDAAYAGMLKMTKKINKFENKNLSVAEVAIGFIKVANETMSRPIREITSAKGFDPSNHTLACFGGAGGPHACAIARSLGIKKILIHKYSGVLSAFGLSRADIIEELQQPASILLNENDVNFRIFPIIDQLTSDIKSKFCLQGFENIQIMKFLHLRFVGSDTCIPVEYYENAHDCIQEFYKVYLREYGFILSNRNVIIDVIRVRGTAKTVDQARIVENQTINTSPISTTRVYFETETGLENFETPIYSLNTLPINFTIQGPALLISDISCIVLETKTTAIITEAHDVEINLNLFKQKLSSTECDNVLLSLFSHRFMSIAEQMGRVLQRTSISTNIKERLDYSCAIFSNDGSLVANAPHLPVHLGSMQEAVKKQIKLIKN